MKRPFHILLVEDSPTHALLIRDVLEAREEQVVLTVAESLREARSALAESSFDLVISDLMLPDGKGLEILKEGPETPFPAIILTGHGDEQAAVDAIKGGALDYVVKTPENLKELPHTIYRVLREWEHITERKKAEETAASFGRILDASLNEIYVCDAGTLKFIRTNQGAKENLGYTEEELRKLTPLDLSPELTPEFFSELLAPLRKGQKKIIQFTSMHRRKDGSLYPIEGHMQLLDEGAQPVFLAVILDITQRMKAEKALRDSEERFRTIFETTSAGMVVISQEGKFLKANRAICDFLGYTEEELLKLSVEEITHPEDREKVRQNYSSIYEGHCQAFHYEKRYLHKDGHVLWGHASVACVQDSDLNPLYCVGLVQDITERKIIEEKLHAANRELDAFVYTVSHDLRTPLTPIIGFAQVLQENLKKAKLDVHTLSLAEGIEKQGKQMLALLEDLLTLAKVGKVEIPAEPANADKVLDEVLISLNAQITKAGVEVRRQPLPSLAVPETLLAQVLENLIGNAIRYGGKKAGPIEVGGKQMEEKVLIWVRDHGPGIQKKEREQIFEVFYRGSTGEKTQGTGIGLATVRKIARLYEGEAWVEETPGGGATFLVEFRSNLK